LALLGSSGAALTSTFHQLSGGKRGRGAGNPEPRCTPCASPITGADKDTQATTPKMRSIERISPSFELIVKLL
jgi:hypothetical protein